MKRNVYIEKKCGKGAQARILDRSEASDQKRGYRTEAQQVSRSANLNRRTTREHIRAVIEQKHGKLAGCRYWTEARQGNTRADFEKKRGKRAHTRGYWTEARQVSTYTRLLNRNAGSEHIRVDIEQKRGKWSHTRGYWTETREASIYARILKRNAVKGHKRAVVEQKHDKRSHARILKKSAASEHIRAYIEQKRGKNKQERVLGTGYEGMKGPRSNGRGDPELGGSRIPSQGMAALNKCLHCTELHHVYSVVTRNTNWFMCTLNISECKKLYTNMIN